MTAREEALRAELCELARTLPSLLTDPEGQAWRAESDPLRWPAPALWLTRDDGMGVTIHAQRLHAARFEILGRQPQHGPYWYRFDIEDGRITVTRAKTPEQIADEIRRRLVPQLDITAREIGTRQMAHAAAVGVVEDAVRLLETVPGVTSHPVTETDRRSGYDDRRELDWNRQAPYDHPHARIKVHHSDGRAVFELEGRYLTPAIVHAALAAMQHALTAQARSRHSAA